MMNDNLFVTVLDSVVVAEAAKQSLRETIFWQVVSETTCQTRVDEDTYAGMKQTADTAFASSTAELFCDNRVVEEFNFISGDTHRQLISLRRLYDATVQYRAWYEDTDYEGEGIGFCWPYNDRQYRLIFNK